MNLEAQKGYIKGLMRQEGGPDPKINFKWKAFSFQEMIGEIEDRNGWKVVKYVGDDVLNVVSHLCMRL